MSEIKKILEEQLEREKNSAMKQLTTSNLDAMYKLVEKLLKLSWMQERILSRSIATASMTKT